MGKINNLCFVRLDINLIGDFCLSFNTELGFLLDQFSKKLLCKMIKERAILIGSCVDDQELA